MSSDGPDIKVNGEITLIDGEPQKVESPNNPIPQDLQQYGL